MALTFATTAEENEYYDAYADYLDDIEIMEEDARSKEEEVAYATSQGQEDFAPYVEAHGERHAEMNAPVMCDDYYRSIRQEIKNEDRRYQRMLERQKRTRYF